MGRPNPLRRLNYLAVVICGCLLLTATTANAEPLRVLSQNMNRFFDDIDNGSGDQPVSTARFRKRVEIAAGKFGGEFDLPHIIALQEVENLNVLSSIAIAIETNFGARYQQRLIPGQDLSGINLGFLVRHGVDIKKVEQLFSAHNQLPENHPLFSRPPLYLQACIKRNCLSLLNLHLRSMRDIDSARDGDRIRRKRLQQAETLARWSQRFQDQRPRESLLLLGDFNALTPGDAQVDVAGILRGNPDNTGVRLQGRDLLHPDLIDLSARIKPARRYSFIFRRQKQQLDYMLINRAFAAEIKSIAFSAIDYGFSDHAGLLAEFEW